MITFKKLKKKLGDKEIYEKVRNNSQPLIDPIHRAAEKIRKRRDLSADNIKYFIVKKPLKLQGFTFFRKSTRG